MPIEGATVSLQQIQSDGSIQTVSAQSVQSGSDGAFSVTTKVNGYPYLIAVATKGNNKYMSIVDASVQSGKTVYCSPITPEATAETRIFISTFKQNPNAYVSLNVIRAITDDSLSSILNNDTTLVEPVASAFLQRETSRINMLQSTYIAASSTQLSYIESIQNQFAINLDNRLYNNYNITDSVTTAYNDFYNFFSDSYNLGGLSNLAYMEVGNTTDLILLNNSTNLSQPIQFQLNKQRALYMSYAIRKEMVSQFTAASASSAVMDSVNKSNASLFSSFQNASTNNEIKQAYTTYHSQIFSLIKKVYSTDVDSLVKVNNDIIGQGGLKSQLDGNLSNNPSGTSIMQAFMSYFTSIRSSISNRFPNATNTKLHILYSVFEGTDLSM